MTPDEDAWIMTFMGKKFYPLDPEGSDYCIEDIAHALSNICRFTGHCNQFYSVAQHSMIVSELVSRKYAVWGLMHDASEAYITDIARPLKHLGAFFDYRKLEKRTMNAICKKFGIEGDEPQEVKDYDALILRNEAKCLKLLTKEWHHYALPDMGMTIVPMLPEDAEKAFLKRWNTLRRD